MNELHLIAHMRLFLLPLLACAFLAGCAASTRHVEEHTRGEEVHGSAAGEASEGSEESGTQLGLGATIDEVRKGARLVLRYDAPSNSFVGTVENTTDKPLAKVRVEVHLSNGTELGPTPEADLAPGAKRDVLLEASEKKFESWSAHAEVGADEHAKAEGGEHASGEKGEHD